MAGQSGPELECRYGSNLISIEGSMKRREFVVNAARGLGGAWLAGKLSPRRAWATELPALTQKFNAHDTVTLGKTGIATSRLAMGTGTHGFGGRSDQTTLG